MNIEYDWEGKVAVSTRYTYVVVLLQLSTRDIVYRLHSSETVVVLPRVSSRSRMNRLEKETYLPETIHSPVITDPDHPLTLAQTLFRRHCTSEIIVGASMRYNSRWTSLDHMDRYTECPRQCLDLDTLSASG